MVSTRREFLTTTLGTGAGLAAAISLPVSAPAGAASSAAGSGQPMTSDEEMAMRKAVDLAALIRGREVSSEELTRYFIERIERYDEKINAIVVRDFERALGAARRADEALARGESLGPLHGIPMTIKESYDIEGLPTTWGIPGTEKGKVQADAVVVDRFQAAGAHFMGKTNVPINLGDFQSYNAIYGTTNNPWDLGRTPGGSSGGSAAALASGMTALDSGSDIGGSIRNPAHFCGVYGHKPTLGIIPMRGHQPPGAPQLPQDPDLAVVGPLARSAEDLALALDVLAGPDVLQSPGWRLELPEPRKTTLRGMRVALWPTDEMAPVASEVADRVTEVGSRLEKLGATVSETARPAFGGKASHDVYMPILNGMMDAQNSDLTYGAWMMLNGRRGGLRVAWQQFFRDWDILLCPTTATPAFPQDESDPTTRTLDVDGERRPYFEQVFWAGLATVSYLPSTVFPTGLSKDGLPIGLQAISAEYHDRTTIEFARLAAEVFGGFVAPPGY